MTLEAKKGGLRRAWEWTFGRPEDWTVFERSWLAVFTAVNLVLFVVAQDTWLSLTSSLTGMLCVVLVAKGRISNYLFGTIQCVTCAIVAYGYGLYGETQLSLLVYLPMQVLGVLWWRRHAVSRQVADQGEDVRARRLSCRQLVGVLLGSVVAVILYVWFLRQIGGRVLGLDSATNVLSLVASILMVLSFTEQWLLWIIVDLISVAMWVWTLRFQEGQSWTLVVMWVAFLVNACYGYWNWLRMSRHQRQVLDAERVAAQATAAPHPGPGPASGSASVAAGHPDA